MKLSEKYPPMTEEAMRKEREMLEERDDWEWEGRRPFVPDSDNSPYKV